MAKNLIEKISTTHSVKFEGDLVIDADNMIYIENESGKKLLAEIWKNLNGEFISSTTNLKTEEIVNQE